MDDADLLHPFISQPLEFSFDIFYNILLFFGDELDDMTFLWTTGREVSREFKNAVEHLFHTKYVKQTQIAPLRDDGAYIRPFNFSHLDPEDGGRAIFKAKYRKKKAIKELELRRTLEHGNLVNRPGVVVQVGKFPDDTLIPGLRVFVDDKKILNLSVEWKGMYSEFFREEKERKRREKEIERQMEKTAMQKANESSPCRPEDLPEKMMTFFFQYLLPSARVLDSVRFDVRAERIARNMKRIMGVDDWNDPDELGYRRLKDLTPDFKLYSL